MPLCAFVVVRSHRPGGFFYVGTIRIAAVNEPVAVGFPRLMQGSSTVQDVFAIAIIVVIAHTSIDRTKHSKSTGINASAVKTGVFLLLL